MNLTESLLDPQLVIVDVRSPGEYAAGHIPGAFNVPLLNDEARKTVGITYKTKGRDAAVLEGFKLSGPLFATLIEQCKAYAGGKSMLIYCWRGGMRSQTMAWMLRLAGLEVQTIPGGYKTYRKLVQASFKQNYQLKVLGGQTGSGKTAVLASMRKLGAQVLDLEALASHRGSAFGGLGMKGQPGVEHFENELHHQLIRLNPDKDIWLEDESRKIGTVIIHADFWEQKDNAVLFYLDVPLENRIQRIREDYAHFGPEALGNAAKKIGKRLGPQHLKEALLALEEGDIDHFIRKVLVYYDNTYNWSLQRRQGKEIHQINCANQTIDEIAHQLIDFKLT